MQWKWVQKRMRDAAPQEVTVPDGVRPGFLIAVAELVNDTMAARKKSEEALRRLKGRKLGYVYSRKLYDLALTGVEPIRLPGPDGSRGAPVHAEFETTNRSTGEHSTFELEYATDGPLAGVPTIIRHRPRWWLEAVLKLEDGVAAPGGGAGGEAAGPTAQR